MSALPGAGSRILPDGYPTLSEYDRLDEDPCFREMVGFAGRFVDENAAALRYYASRWVANPMESWSRRWEYLYAYQRIVRLATDAKSAVRLLDAGAGLTFFPHFVAATLRSATVECVDRDPILAADARHLATPAEGRVRYSTKDVEALDFADGAFDLALCVSVLEHVPRVQEAIEELHRVLRPGGLLILTIDVAPHGDADIPIEAAQSLARRLTRCFPDGRDLATDVAGFDAGRFLTTEHVRQSVPSRLPWSGSLFRYLSCFCMTLTRP